MSEVWRPVPGYEDRYLISDHGAVWSVVRQRLLRPAVNMGYPTVLLSRGGETRRLRVHRLVLEAFVGPCPPGEEGCHENGDRADARLSNLRWDSRSANVRDSVRHGRHRLAARTHCPREHPLSDANNLPASARRGHRRCWACAKATNYLYTHPEADFAEVADRYYDELVRQRSPV